MNSVTNEPAYKRAHETVMRLMRERRMFLGKEHTLNHQLFAEAIELDQRVRDIYEICQAQTTKDILEEEATLGVAPPIFGKDQTIVRCSRFTGGLDIVSVHSITPFLKFIPQDPGLLYQELFTLLHGAVDEIIPKELPEKIDYTQRLTKTLSDQLTAIPPDSSVLILKTRFDATYASGLSTIRECLKDLTNPCLNSLGLAYLLYKNECARQSVFIERGTLITLQEGEGHAGINHWKGDEFSFLPYKVMGYDYKVMVGLLI